MFSRQWLLTTLLVIAAMAVMARLGIWQLERLDARRAFNARVATQLAQPQLHLNTAPLTDALSAMEYRAVQVVGVYDPSQEVGLRNQAWEGKLGVHLLTPLIISGTDQAVLINRGWVPADAKDWAQFAEPGVVTVTGVIRRSEAQPDFGGVPDPEGVLRLWNLVNVERIRQQITHPLLPIYIQQNPDPAWTTLPYRTTVSVEISEGSHFGYAMQWFLFALVLGVGYPFYVRDAIKQKAK